MSATAHAPVMSTHDGFGTGEPPTPDDALATEIARYLDAIALFRELGCEPAWLPEAASCLVVRAHGTPTPFERRVSQR